MFAAVVTESKRPIFLMSCKWLIMDGSGSQLVTLSTLNAPLSSFGGNV